MLAAIRVRRLVASAIVDGQADTVFETKPERIKVSFDGIAFIDPS